MNILYCGDSNVEMGIFMSAFSLCKNTDRQLNIYILTASTKTQKGITQDFANKLQIALTEKNANNKVFLFDVSDVFDSYLPTANMGTRFTPLCMLRLFADLVPQIPDKVLYLDADVLCCSDFVELYDMDISELDMVGAADRYGKWFFGNIFKHDFINSGVLLFNMANVRKNGLFLKCREMCRDVKMFLPDQSALNKLAKFKKVSNRYNNQRKIKPDTVFKHFTTFFKIFPYVHPVTIKPWQVDNMHNVLKIFVFDDIIEEYYKRML